jgi:hypothetical protein
MSLSPEATQKLNAAKQLLAQAKTKSKECLYELAIEVSEKALKDAIAATNDEMSPLLIEFYLAYADHLMVGVMTSNDIFCAPMKKAIINKEIKAAELEEQKAAQPISAENKSRAQIIFEEMEVAISQVQAKAKELPKEEKKDVSIKVEDDDVKSDISNDDEAIWENLEIARVIAQKQVDADKESADKYSSMLSDIYMKEAEFLSSNEEYELAIEECKKAADIRMADPTSRRLAEVYFMMGLYKSAKIGKEKEALEYYHLARKILEAKLKILQGKEYKPTETVDYELVIIGETDSNEVKDLKEVLKDLFDKILEVNSQMEQVPELKKEAGKSAVEQDKFDAPILQEKKPTDLGTLSKRKNPDASLHTSSKIFRS